MRWLFIFLILLAGCSSHITDIGPLLPKREQPLDFISPNGQRFIFRDYNKTLDSFLEYHFTDEAYKALRDIPLVGGPCYAPYAAGVNGWSNLASFLTFNGVGRKVIMTEETLGHSGVKALIHEYVHHLDDLTRDGDASFIDLEEFKDAYTRLSKEWRGIRFDKGTKLKIMIHTGKIENVEKAANHWFTDMFGIGDMSEHIAYSTRYILGKEDVPDYFNRVFRKVFRTYEDLE